MKTAIRTMAAVLAVTVISTHASFANVAPEIDPAMGTGALALLGGVILVVRGRKRS